MEFKDIADTLLKDPFDTSVIKSMQKILMGALQSILH